MALHKADIKGFWTVTLHNQAGSLVTKVSGENVFTTSGKVAWASYLATCVTAAYTFPFNYVAVGTDSTAEAVGNTALGAEVLRVTGTASYQATGIYQVIATFGTGVGSLVVTEYGLFNTITSGGGTLCARDTEAAIAKSSTDVLTVQTQITFS